MNLKKMFIILGLSLAFANTAMANEETAPLAHIPGIVTSPYEYEHENHGHTGVDILYRVGTPLYAPISGKVEFLAGEGMDGRHPHHSERRGGGCSHHCKCRYRHLDQNNDQRRRSRCYSNKRAGTFRISTERIS